MTQVKWPFSTFHHVHVVVRDMVRVQDTLAALGIPLHDYDHKGKFIYLNGIADPATAAPVHYKRAEIGPVHFQFMSPKDERDSMQKRFLAENGNGVYSIGFVVDDLDKAEAEAVRRGLRLLKSHRHEDGWGTCYFDAVDTLGIHLNIRQNERVPPRVAKAEWPFSKFHHVHLVVKDIARVEAFLGKIGVPLSDYDHPGDYKVLDGTTREILARSPYKYAELGPYHWQVTSQIGNDDSGRRRFIDKYANRVYSVGFVVDDLEAAEAEAVRRGLKPLKRGRHEDGWGYTYFDTFDLLGILLTIRQNPKGQG